MEKELNIAAILKEKPKDTRLHDVARNVTLLFLEIDEYENIKCSLIDGLILEYTNTGSMYQFPTGMEVLKPSKEMQDWEKFAWKKGDVLYNVGLKEYCVFNKFINDDYLVFISKYNVDENIKSVVPKTYDPDKNTADYEKVSDEKAAEIISLIEKHYGGKLNLETLQIDKQEFNEGDIVFVKGEAKDSNSIGIVMNVGNGLNYHYWANYFYKTGVLRVAESCDDYVVGHSRYEEVRLANSSEKQKLFSALEKEGKHWNPDTKQIEDLPKKCEYKPMDWCLMKDYCDNRWSLCQFGFYLSKEDSVEGADYYPYCAVGGQWFHECIPYNDSTKHLLGTTDEWKGGEG